MAATVERANDGATAQGTPIEVVTLRNDAGVTARILTFGATLQAFEIPDRAGRMADVVLGHDHAADYVAHQTFFGVTVGRYANRIAGGRFSLDGKTYQLPLNDGKNSLHGGGKGFDQQVWQVRSAKGGDTASVVLALHSPDGADGYPGALDVTVTYTLDAQGALTVAYAATTTAPTIVNMTNHALFNLAGEGAPQGAMGQRLTIPARAYTPVNAALIPTGELRPVAGTPFDFTRPRVIAEALRDGNDDQIVVGRGYDHNFAIDAGVTAQPKLVGRLEDSGSGRVLEVLSTEPGVQFYTGNFLNGTVIGKHGHLYRMGDGVALEPQKFPDAPNQPSFASARVDPGKPYRHVLVFRPSLSK